MVYMISNNVTNIDGVLWDKTQLVLIKRIKGAAWKRELASQDIT